MKIHHIAGVKTAREHAAVRDVVTILAAGGGESSSDLMAEMPERGVEVLVSSLS